MSGPAYVNDFDASIAWSIRRVGLGAVARLRGADTGPAHSGGGVDRPLQQLDHADRALTRQLEVVLVSKRFDGLIIGMADNQHTTRDLVQCEGETP